MKRFWMGLIGMAMAMGMAAADAQMIRPMQPLTKYNGGLKIQSNAQANVGRPVSNAPLRIFGNKPSSNNPVQIPWKAKGKSNNGRPMWYPNNPSPHGQWHHSGYWHHGHYYPANYYPPMYYGYPGYYNPYYPYPYPYPYPYYNGGIYGSYYGRNTGINFRIKF